MKTIEFNNEQINMIVSAIERRVKEIEIHQLEINKPSYDEYSGVQEVRESLTCEKLKYQTLLNYIEQV